MLYLLSNEEQAAHAAEKAARLGDVETFRALVEAGWTPTHRTFGLAAASGCVPILRMHPAALTMRACPPVDLSEHLPACTCTAPLLAAMNNDLDTLEYLLLTHPDLFRSFTLSKSHHANVWNLLEHYGFVGVPYSETSTNVLNEWAKPPWGL